MQRNPSNRKRAAPGASPMMQQPGAQSAFDYSQLPQNTDGVMDADDFPWLLPLVLVTALAPVAPSTDLVRRARNHQLAPQATQQQDQWNGGYNNMSGQNDDENEQELEKKVALAKRDAQGKRKQIPPFVQKLSRYVSR